MERLCPSVWGFSYDSIQFLKYYIQRYKIYNSGQTFDTAGGELVFFMSDAHQEVGFRGIYSAALFFLK